jgi:hypothetical protein
VRAPRSIESSSAARYVTKQVRLAAIRRARLESDEHIVDGHHVRLRGWSIRRAKQSRNCQQEDERPVAEVRLPARTRRRAEGEPRPHNGEVHLEVAASRLFWALDSARTACILLAARRGCPPAMQDSLAASIQRKMAAGR